MKVVKKKKEKKEFVRVIVGRVTTGDSNLKAPTKSMSIEDTDVLQVFKIIQDRLNQFDKNGK